MKFFIVLAATLMVSQTSFAACNCTPPFFSEEDKKEALLSFMENKLDTTAAQVVSMTVIETRAFATFESMTRRFRDASMCDYGTPRGSCWTWQYVYPTQCEVTCKNVANTNETFQVKYAINGKACKVNLEVVMNSRSRYGFSSKIKQKYAANCQ